MALHDCCGTSFLSCSNSDVVPDFWQVFYGLQVVGIMIATTAVNAFLLDAYPGKCGRQSIAEINDRFFRHWLTSILSYQRVAARWELG